MDLHVVTGPTRDCVPWRLSADCVDWRLSADCVDWRLSADCVDWRLSADYTWHWGQRNDERPLTFTRTIVLRHLRHACPSRS